MSNTGTDSHGVIRSDFPGGWAGDSVSIKEGKNIGEMQQKALNFNKKLLTWRKDAKVVHKGKLMHFEPKDGVYTYFKYDNDQTVMVILNKNKEQYDLNLDRFEERLQGYQSGRDIFSGMDYSLDQFIPLEPMKPYILELSKI